MESLINIIYSLLAFILVISIVVFIHEFGHFYFARLFKVKVDKFSIGFGKALIKWHDRKGTQWQVSCIPMGGYVKMHGDANPASTPDLNELAKMTDSEKKLSFHFKPIWQKALIIAAGPMFNYISAILISAFMFYSQGILIVMPKITSIVPDSPAAIAGLLQDDIITEINNKKITNFTELKDTLSMSVGESINLKVHRGNQSLDINLTPKKTDVDDGLGKTIKIYSIGIGANDIQVQNLDIIESFKKGLTKVYELNTMMLKGVAQMISGARGTDEISGPIKIAQYSVKSIESGIYGFLGFIVLISVNLGMVNLLPIPLLDGGHLLVYALEAITRKPMKPSILEKVYAFGFLLILILMFYGIANDLKGILS